MRDKVLVLQDVIRIDCRMPVVTDDVENARRCERRRHVRQPLVAKHPLDLKQKKKLLGHIKQQPAYDQFFIVQRILYGWISDSKL